MSSPLELAARALEAAAGDEAEAFVQVERSGLARFAASVQHQPTLVENTVVTLRVVRDGRVGIAVTNRTGDDGLRDLAERAGETAESTRAEADFPGLPDPAPLPEVEGYEMDEKGRARQLERLAEVKRSRSAADVRASLAALGTAASEDGENLMPRLIDCAKAYCTVGEMVDVLKNRWGEFQQPVVF